MAPTLVMLWRKPGSRFQLQGQGSNTRARHVRGGCVKVPISLWKVGLQLQFISERAPSTTTSYYSSVHTMASYCSYSEMSSIQDTVQWSDYLWRSLDLVREQVYSRRKLRAVIATITEFPSVKIPIKCEKVLSIHLYVLCFVNVWFVCNVNCLCCLLVVYVMLNESKAGCVQGAC